jgi:hypothetical protein
MIWSWLKGDARIYTKNYEIVKKAMIEGYYVDIITDKSHIIKRDSL